MKVAIIQGSVSPYRVDLFNYLIDKYGEEIEFSILYAAKPRDFGRTWTIDETNMKNSQFLKSKGIKIEIGKYRKLTNIPNGVFERLNSINPDIVIGAEYNPSTVISYIWTQKNKKIYISWSDGTLHSEKDIGYISKKIRKIICSKSHACIASSTQTKEAQIYYGADEKKIFISYLTVDLEKYIVNTSNRTGKKILFVGRLLKLKGIDLALKALSKINEEYIFYIVGDGEEREYLENLCTDLKISDKVKFLGYLEGNDLREIYKACDIFLFPSLNDCFGLVLIEAMCAKMAIISSIFAGASLDVIEENLNGMIVNPYDIDILKFKIEDLLKDSITTKRFGQKSFELKEKFKFSNTSEKILEAINYSLKSER